MTRLIRALTGVLLLTTLLAACGPSEEEQAAAAADAARRAAAAAKANAAKKAAAADPTANMARAVVVGKSQAVVDLKYEIAAKPLVGEAVEIDLALLPSIAGDSMSLNIAPAGTGLTLDGDLAPSTNEVKVGQPWHVNLIAHAAKPEVYYFTVAVDHYSAGIRSTRNFAIPIIVSAPVDESTEASSGKPEPDADSTDNGKSKE